MPLDYHNISDHDMVAMKLKPIWLHKLQVVDNHYPEYELLNLVIETLDSQVFDNVNHIIKRFTQLLQRQLLSYRIAVPDKDMPTFELSCARLVNRLQNRMYRLMTLASVEPPQWIVTRLGEAKDILQRGNPDLTKYHEWFGQYLNVVNDWTYDTIMILNAK